MARDLHHLQELEDRLAQLEDQVLAGELEDFNPRMTTLGDCRLDPLLLPAG